MILPSDGDPPPRRKDKDNDGKVPPQEPQNEEWWEQDDADDEDPEDIDDMDEDDGDESGPDPEEMPPGPVLKSVAAPGWRENLVLELVESVADLHEIEDPDDEYDPPEPPDLYTFFGELAALRNELRRIGRRSDDSVVKTAEALNSVQGLLRTLSPVSKKAKASAEPWPVETCLALVSLHDLLMRISPDSAAVAAAAASLDPLLKAAGMERIVTEGRSFDPATMTIAGAEAGGRGSGKSVIREAEAGFLRAGALLRPARVMVSG
ncbi:MAG: nucleotide exchange factor GrpE [Verrucomicrobiales bacterium]|nr:nucleotide exchange factor GrpE [Verrucomicrobiales bacterium]